MQAIGVAVAARVRASPRGCVTGYVGEVVRAFEAMPDTWLLGRFVKGRTHLVTIHQGRPLLDDARYDWVDVQEVHSQVLRATAAVDRASRSAT